MVLSFYKLGSSTCLCLDSVLAKIAFPFQRTLYGSGTAKQYNKPYRTCGVICVKGRMTFQRDAECFVMFNAVFVKFYMMHRDAQKRMSKLISREL